MFLKYGNEKDLEGYDPKYDYGGSGHLTTEQDQADYNRLAKVLINHHYKNSKDTSSRKKPMGFSQAVKDPLTDVIGDWRFGVNSKKGRVDDRGYYQRFMEGYRD